MFYCLDNIFIQGKATVSYNADNGFFRTSNVGTRLHKRDFYRSHFADKYMDCFVFSAGWCTWGNNIVDT